MELLVVIAIIMVLIALLLPAISRAWAQARFVKCAANLRSQIHALHAYAQDYHSAKPPLYQKGHSRIRFDYISPDIKWSNQPVGQGLLVAGKYLSLEVLLDPSEAMGEDTDRDRLGWDEMLDSGSSYVYYWRSPPPDDTVPDPVAALDALATGVTLENAAKGGNHALVWDINADNNNRYFGEYSGRTWINHPRMKQLNVGYFDGSVKAFPIAAVMLRDPFDGYQELLWMKQANDRY